MSLDPINNVEPDIEPEPTGDPAALEAWKAEHEDIVASNNELAARSAARRAARLEQA